MNHLRNIAIISFIILYAVVISGFIVESESNVLCTKINIEMDSINVSLIESDILNIMEENDFYVLGKPKNNINIEVLEDILNNQFAIKKSEVFLQDNGILNISVSQRIPIARIINSKGINYFIDSDGYIFPVTSLSNPHLLIVNGHIHEPFNIKKVSNIFENRPNKLSEKHKIIYDVLVLIKYLHQNKFWNAQVQQLYVNEDFEFEIIPRVGAHFIILGGIDEYKEKFEKLMLLYKEGFNKIGWNDYEYINLKYRNQIVCTKR